MARNARSQPASVQVLVGESARVRLIMLVPFDGIDKSPGRCRDTGLVRLLRCLVVAASSTVSVVAAGVTHASVSGSVFGVVEGEWLSDEHGLVAVMTQATDG